MKKPIPFLLFCLALLLCLYPALASAEGETFTLVTDASQLSDGDQILLVSDDGANFLAMAAGFGGAQVTVSNNSLTAPATAQSLTLVATEGGWRLSTGAGYLAVSGGALTTVTAENDASLWSISVSGDTAAITSDGTSVCFDETNFYCGSGGNPVAIYSASVEQPLQPCGDNLGWRYANGVLTIEGNGKMYDYSGNNAPWSSYRSEITQVKLPDGLTSIGYSAFYGCTGLTSVTIPYGVTRIGECAFSHCTGLTSVIIPDR